MNAERRTRRHTSVVVEELPGCDLCKDIHDVDMPAYADARIPAYGSWANVCWDHFNDCGCTLGLGRGQRLIRRRDGEDHEPTS